MSADAIQRVIGAAMMATAWLAATLLCAAAQAPSSWDMCNNEGKAYPPDIVIYGCTAVISAGGSNPQNLAVAFNNRGLAFRAKGEVARALADYDEAVRLDPGYAGVFNNRGVTLHDRGDLDRAFADYDEAIRLDPKNATAFTNRGIAYRDKGDLDRAIADYNEAIRLDPRHATAFTNRGNAYREMGDLDRAAADYSEAIVLDPMNAVAFNNRGAAYLIKGDLDHALVYYSEAIRLDPRYGRPRPRGCGLRGGDPDQSQIRQRLHQPRRCLSG